MGSLRNAASGSIILSGIKGQVRRAYLYWHGPMNTDFPLANASIRMDNDTVTGVHIGTSDDNCWGFDNSQAYRADVTSRVANKRNGTYLLTQFVKQGTNINANGASLLVFFDDGNTNNNRDIVLFEGNDSNAPNGFDALGWNAILPGVNYTSGKAYLQMHVSDGQIYADDSVILNGTILQGRGSIFQGTSVPAANNGPFGFGNLWDIKTWDITSSMVAGTNDFLLTHGYIQHDCISLVVAAFDLPAAAAPPTPPPTTNSAPTVVGTPEITINHPNPIVLEAQARDNDGDGLNYTIAVDTTIVQSGDVPAGTPQTLGTLAVTNAFTLGDHLVVFTVTDGKTNASFTTIVHVIDNTPPTIFATNIVVPTDPGKTTAVVNYVVTATDDFPGNVTILSLPAPGGEFAIGVTLVTVTAVDNTGNRAEKTFTITVTDALPPTITCPTDLVRFTDPGTNVAVVNYTVNFSDNQPGASAVCVPPSGSVFPLGTSAVNCTATDAAGNRATCAFNVTVNVMPPVNRPPTLTGLTNIIIISNAPIVVTATAGDIDGNALGYVIRIDDVVVQDGTIPAGTPVTLGDLNVTNTFGLGVHAVVFEVFDGQAGATWTTTVRVIDDQPPVIHVPPNIVVPVDPGTNVAIVNFTVRADDNFPGLVQIVIQPDSGNAFPIGTTTVVVTATDSSGNTATATFTVTVIDNVPPTIVCPPNLVRFADRGANNAVVTYTVLTADNLPGATVVCVPASGSVFPMGTTPVNCTVTDLATNRASCSFNVTVSPEPDIPTNRPPAVVGQPEIIIHHPNPIVVAALATDDDGNPLTFTIRVDGVDVQTGTIPGGTPQTVGTLSVTNAFTLGQHMVVFQVNDGVTNASFTTVVRVIDNTPPDIHVPNNIVVPVDPGGNTAVVNFTVTATDDFPGQITIVSQPASGSQFPFGTTIVTVTATDSSGNSATATFTVTVIDNVPPTITCPSDLVRFADPGANGAVVTYTVTAVDNVPGATVVCVPPSGSTFPVGTNAVNCTVTDLATNRASCSFRVIVNATPVNRAPTLAGETNIIVNSSSPIVVSATATDLDGDSLAYVIRVDGVIVQTGVVPPGTPITTGTLSVTNGFSLGTHLVVFEVNDGRQSATLTTTVRVVDNTPPVINVPQNILVPVDPGTNVAIVNFTVTANDNFPGPILIVVQPDSGNAFPVGTTTVVVTATDSSGNTATAIFTVTVIDNVPPTIVCPPNLVRFADRGANNAVVTYTVLTSDNLPGATVVCVPPSGSVFPMGTTPVNCTVTDLATNRASCSFNVTVLPEPDFPTNRPPAVVGQDVIIIYHPNPIVVGALGTDDDGNPLTFIIRVDGVVVRTGTIPGSTLDVTNAFTLGQHLVVFLVDDGVTNAIFTTVVRVIDNTPPDIHVPDNIVVPVDPGRNTAVVNFTVTATDDFPGPITIVSQPASGSQFPLGTTIVTATATDSSGNRATATFTITVVDNVPPTINCPPDIIRFNDPGTNGAFVQYTVNATDNLAGVSVTCVPVSGTFFPIGTTPVTCTARDAAGNRATCLFNVTIKDQPPVVTVPTNMIVTADLGQCSARVNYTVTVVDNTPGWTLVCTPPSGSLFPNGTTTVVCIATDAAGNRVTNTFTVTVEDREKPVLHLPADITVTIPTNQSSAVVNYVVTATDNCSAVTIVSVPASGSSFPVGTTIVQSTATDGSGNVATGSFRVNVVREGGSGDTEPPVIISITPSKPCLWPPNHKMVTVTFAVKATDNSGRPVTARIISITSNEPENELGDGNTEHDWAITGSLKAQLRAERSGLGEGRIYTIVIEVKDAAGNVTTGMTTVCVPHDQGHKDAMLAAAAGPAPKVVAPAKLVRVKPAPVAKKK